MADRINARIQKFAPDGTFLLMLGWGVATGAAQFEICTSGCQAGVYGTGDGQFGETSVDDLAVDAADTLYAADRNNDRIQKFTPDGTFLSKFGSLGSSAGQLYSLESVAVDSSGNIFVADTGNHRIQKFNSSGASLTVWGARGTGDGQFEYPSGVAVDAAGNVHVADTGNDRVQKFDSNGAFIGKWGGTAWGTASSSAARRGSRWTAGRASTSRTSPIVASSSSASTGRSSASSGAAARATASSTGRSTSPFIRATST